MTTAKEDRNSRRKRMHPGRYLVNVDHRTKRSYDSLDEANAEAKRISDKFPLVCVQVLDSHNNSLSQLERDEKHPDASGQDQES